MFFFVVHILKYVRTRFFLFSFQFWWINFIVCFAAPCEIMIVFQLVWTIILNTLRALNPIESSYMIPLLAVFTLRYTQIYICLSNCCNIASDIEASIDEFPHP